MIKDFRERVKKAREDDGEAASIIKDFEPLIKKCIRMYIREPGGYEDALQEGRLAIYSCIINYDLSAPTHFEGYVKMAVIYSIRNLAAKYKENVSLDEDLNEGGGSLHDLIDSGIDIEGEEIKRSEISSLKEALNSLTEKERSAIEGFYFEGKSMREMSKGRRCHYMTVVKNKERALGKLREAIGGVEE